MKSIELSKGMVAFVDDEDYEWLNQWKWTLADRPSSNLKYARRNIYIPFRSSEMMHRVILGITDRRVQVDHIDRNGLNNQRSNLRMATQSQNNANRKLKPSPISGYLGVAPNNSKINPWRAVIRKDRKKYNIGQYPNKEQAALAYNVMAKRLYGEFATFNNLCAQRPK